MYTKADYLSDCIGALQPIRTAIEALVPFQDVRAVEHAVSDLMGYYQSLEVQIAGVRDHPCGLNDRWHVPGHLIDVYAWLDKHPARPTRPQEPK